MKQRDLAPLTFTCILFAFLAQAALASTAGLSVSQNENTTDSTTDTADSQSASSFVPAETRYLNGLLPPAIPVLLLAGKGSIEGMVWHDVNGDGARDFGEPGLKNVTVFVDGDADGVYTFGEPSARTDPDGNFRISGLKAGVHTVTVDMFTLPADYGFSTLHPLSIQLSREQEYYGADFGFQLWSGIISGFLIDTDTFTGWALITVFLDINENGIYDEGEPAAVTDLYGQYTFTGLPPETYTVRILPGDLPEGYSLPTGQLTYPLEEGEEIYYAHFFTDPLPARVESHVFDDANGNGVREPDEDGLAGITVYADANNNGMRDSDEIADSTDTAGKYTLTGLPHGAGWIRIEEATLPDNYLLTTKNLPLYRILVPGEIYTSADFGYQHLLAVMHPNGYPTRIALRSGGRMYVSDIRSNSVFMYDSGLNLTGELKGLGRPLGIAADAQDRIYIGNDSFNNVEIYTSAGIKMGTLTGDGVHNIRMPNDLALDRDGKLYVADSQNAMVLVFNPADGSLTATIGAPGSGDGQFTFPKALAIHYRVAGAEEVGELYVADQATHLIQVFDLQGNFIRSFGGPVQTTMSGIVWEGLFSAIQGLAFDQSGRLLVLDLNLDVIQILDPLTGDFIDYYFAYLLANHGYLNLQMDLEVNNQDEVIITNVATSSLELLEKTNTAP